MTTSRAEGEAGRGDVALQRLARALKHDDQEELVVALGEISALLPTAPQLIGPLIDAVDRLGDDPRSLVPALQAARYVAHRASPGDLHQRALASILKFARALSMYDLAQALEDMRFVAESAAANSEIERDAVADWTGQLFRISVREPALTLALARSTADGAPAGGLLEQEAVRSWSRQIDELSGREPLQALAATRYAADYAAPGRALEREAVISWSRQIDVVARDDPALAITAAHDAARFARANGAMQQTAVLKEREFLRAGSSATGEAQCSTSRTQSEPLETVLPTAPPDDP